MPNKDLEKLREMTSTLPQFPPTVSQYSGFKTHKMESGNSFAWNLDTSSGEKASIAKWFNSKGTFPAHTHDAREWLIVIEGSLFIAFEGEEEKRLLPGQYVCIEPMQKHYVRFIEDCWYYAITVPREPNWPS